ncbi:MAG: Hsp20/alpha crystallin family protein [Balneolaceae bacterium]|nr:Hsp20/alpha crystallin family protein [Balneolaceae bacterium]
MKSLEKRREFTPIEDLRREMDRLFDEMVPFSWWKERGENSSHMWTPRTDMSETETKYLIHVDLPGLTKDDITINIKDNRLTISGKRKKEMEEKDENFLRRERFKGSFLRTFTFPDKVKDEKVKATFNDGVLTVNVPKAEVSKPKTVKID